MTDFPARGGLRQEKGHTLVGAIGYNHVRGLPLKAAELAQAIGELVSQAEGVEVDLGVHGLAAARSLTGKEVAE
ncbi:MAG: hypothetical protein ABIQ15_14075 [Nocardioides sp.]